MSTAKSVTVFCDKNACQNRFEGSTGETTRDVRAAAKANSWKLGKSKDFCPSCSAEISEAISRARTGEI